MSVSAALHGTGNSLGLEKQPVYSMTGYARVAVRPENAPALSLTLKSINHRFLDLQLRLPAGAEPLEATVRAALKASLSRGHIECTLTLDRPARRDAPERRPVATEIDVRALREYVEHFRAACAAVGLPGQEPDLNLAMRLPGMLLGTTEEREEPNGEEQGLAEAALLRETPPLLMRALAALKAMRAAEGAALASLLHEGLDRLTRQVDEVGALRAGVQDAHFARIAERLVALVGRSFDRDRVLTEAALLTERGDVEEEVARMHTHIAHFRALLDGGGDVGKKLDFLLQEMNREANTLLSKTAGVTGGGARITECGLAMKAEIEKLREQVQNLE